MNIEVIGIDHVFVTVADLKVSEAFYDRVMRVLGFRKNSFSNEGDRHIQYYNRHFGFVLRPAEPGAQRYHSLNPGLHHFCFRVPDPATIDRIAREFRTEGIDCSPPQFYSEYASDYYATFFSDPDGIRLEVTNYRQERKERHDKWSSEG